MRTNYLLYYLLRLIKNGQEWNNKDLNGQSTGSFSLLQFVAFFVAGLYVWRRPTGMANNSEVIDYVLSSLSITTALLFSIIVVVLDRARQYKFDGKTEKEQLNDIHQWNYLYQFSSITGNAILWSLLVIVLLICSMLFGHNYNLRDYRFVGFSNIFNFEYVRNFMIYTLVVAVRFIIVYGLLNFFILFLYSLLCLYESISSELDSKRPNVQLSKKLMVNVDIELNKLISPYNRYFLWLSFFLLLSVMVMYLFIK